MDYDLDGRTTALAVSNSRNEAIWQQAYHYDRLNNITGIERSEGEQRYQQQFGYDLVQRLVRDQGPYGEQQFDYDPVGNRLSQTQTHTTHGELQREDYHYAPASNRLLGTSDKQMLLDPAGNILRETNELQREYRYNAQNRISEYHENGQLKARYHYNALGQRIHKAVIQADGTEAHTLFHYGLQGELLGETRLNDTSQISSQNIVWLQMRPVVALDSSEQNATPHIAWLHSDHLLTARAATDESQNLIWRWHSDAFGVGEAKSLAQAGQSALTLNLRFPGQYHDIESGLYYNYFRTYDPSKGRYTQSDPIGLLEGVNTFAYVDGNPVIAMDPLGLEILLQTHPVMFGNDHAKIVIIPQDQEAWVNHPRFSNRTDEGRVYATLGAGSENSSPFNLGRLVAGFNREKDVILEHNRSSVSVIEGMCISNETENSLIEIFFANHESYRNSLDYAFFPDAGSSTFNSNSYISGFLLASGYTLPQPANTPGFEIPVPIDEFVYD